MSSRLCLGHTGRRRHPCRPVGAGARGGGGAAGCGALGMSSKAYARARRVVMGGPRGGRVPAALKAPVAAGNFSRLFREPWLPGTHEHSGTTHLRCVHARAHTHTDRHRYTNNTHRDSLSLSLSLSLTRAAPAARAAAPIPGEEPGQDVWQRARAQRHHRAALRRRQEPGGRRGRGARGQERAVPVHQCGVGGPVALPVHAMDQLEGESQKAGCALRTLWGRVGICTCVVR
jgi:hypothetical protein